MITLGVPPGTYRHKKGGRYVVLHNAVTVDAASLAHGYKFLYSAKHSDDTRAVLVVVSLLNGEIYVIDKMGLGQSVVVYLSLIYGEFWVRPEPEWHDIVEWEDGVKRKRFIREDFE